MAVPLRGYTLLGMTFSDEHTLDIARTLSAVTLAMTLTGFV